MAGKSVLPRAGGLRSYLCRLPHGPSTSRLLGLPHNMAAGLEERVSQRQEVEAAASF